MCGASLTESFVISGEPLTTETENMKQPGDRVALPTDVCPSSLGTTGMQLESSISDLEASIAFKSWIADIRIPEECVAYRFVLDDQTIDVNMQNSDATDASQNNVDNVLEPLALSAGDDSTIIDLMYQMALDGGLEMQDSGY